MGLSRAGRHEENTSATRKARWGQGRFLLPLTKKKERRKERTKKVLDFVLRLALGPSLKTLIREVQTGARNVDLPR